MENNAIRPDERRSRALSRMSILHEMATETTLRRNVQACPSFPNSRTASETQSSSISVKTESMTEHPSIQVANRCP
jgi:hypothetical protein